MFVSCERDEMREGEKEASFRNGNPACIPQDEMSEKGATEEKQSLVIS